MRTRIIAVATVALLAGAAAAVASSTDNPGRGTTLSYYASATKVIAGPPVLGEWASVAWDLHALGGTAEDPEPAGDAIGRMAGTCSPLTETDGAVEGVCLGWIELDGRGLLTLTLKPGSVSFPITGGTGEFAGAEGVGQEPPVAGTANDRVVTIELAGFDRP